MGRLFLLLDFHGSISRGPIADVNIHYDSDNFGLSLHSAHAMSKRFDLCFSSLSLLSYSIMMDAL